MDYKKRLRYEISRRSFILGLGKVGLSSLLLARLGYLQLSEKDYYRTMSDKNRLTAIMVPPSRGKILDRNGHVLASNIRKFDIVIRKTRKDAKQHEILVKLSSLLQLSVFEMMELQAKYNAHKTPTELVLFENVPWFQMVAIEENLIDLPGVLVRDAYRRYYHDQSSLCHVLGYIAMLNSSEKIAMNIRNAGDLKVGKRGLEKSYEEFLRGKFGIREVEINARGGVVRELKNENAVRGEDLHTSIDFNLQKLAYELLPQAGGAILVTNVQSGEILSSLSTPTFDGNSLTQRITPKQWRNLQSAEGNPLINRVVQNLYPPGSIFKLVTLLAALDSGISPNRKIFCDGRPVLGKKSFRCWKRIGHGNIDMYNALKGSCNSYIFNIAKEIGVERILDMAQKMGFGQLTEIDIPEEVKGFLPSPSWKRRRFKQRWSKGDTLNMSIGQGFMLGTLAQISQMTNIIATKGQMAPMHYGLPNNPELNRRIDVASQHFEVLQKGMGLIVNAVGGTAYRSRITKGKHKFAGKTGTSQVMSKQGEEVDLNKVEKRALRNHAVFSGYGPIDNPQFSVSVIVDHGGGGGSVAAPIASKIFNYLFTEYL